jgi:hypothetical protein
MKRRYSSNLAYIDMLFNVLIGFVMLFIIAFLMINPITKKEDIPTKAEIMIILEWDDESADDIDLWVLPENVDGIPISFKSRDVGFWHLDRDDLGHANDQVRLDGMLVILKNNREVASMRGILPGDVLVNVHVYNKSKNEPTPIKVTYIDVNPYKEHFIWTGVATTQGQTFALPGFTVDKEGNVSNVFKHNEKFAAKRPPGEGRTDLEHQRSIP